MVKKLKVAMVVVLSAALLAVPFGSAVAEMDYPFERDRDAGAMAADLLLARPVGLAAIVAGAALFVLSLPFSALGGNTDEAFDNLVADPVEYTFRRPLGDL